MAQLSFTGVQPVAFNGKDCTPEINTGTRLRLGRLQFETEAQIENANKVLASCFPNDEDYVLEFLETKMLPNDKKILQAYLLNGEKAIAMLERTSDAYADKMIEKVLDTLEKGAGNE